MQNTYWNNKGCFQAEYDALVELMPASGNSDTVAGELIRAVSRIGYQFYNNGMGNNVSGAVNFLREWSAIDPEVYNTIYEYSRGRIYNGRYRGDSLQVAVERAVDQTVELITRNPSLITMVNTDDIFNHEEEDEYYDEDEYYEED
jgi:hypothetical protein